MLTASDRKRPRNDVDEDEAIFLKRTRTIVPDFTCEVYHNEQVSPLRLSTLLEHYTSIVLFFYERDLLNYTAFLNSKALPVMVSTDTVMVHRGFCRTHGGLAQPPPFPLVGDQTRLISRHFDVLDLATGNARRSVFIINQQRNIIATFLPTNTGYNMPLITSSIKS
ncbi:hypothetical protein [Absidia glauca]|uniref:Alkyl hydroperoxide reductase subunit C/ Thiol specific antioxidant domain-containing protein n=1 Tax=Absidia glauca TaxID=4829 RepID=A0A163UVB1_ABSGL|nr:hypothetical protein [Absidia glauca]